WIWASRLRREGKWSRDAVGAFGLGMPLIWSDKTLDAIRVDLENQRSLAHGTLTQPYLISVDLLDSPQGFTASKLKAEMHALEARIQYLATLSFAPADSILKVLI